MWSIGLIISLIISAIFAHEYYLNPSNTNKQMDKIFLGIGMLSSLLSFVLMIL